MQDTGRERRYLVTQVKHVVERLSRAMARLRQRGADVEVVADAYEASGTPRPHFVDYLEDEAARMEGGGGPMIFCDRCDEHHPEGDHVTTTRR